jgi:hypothetical protein
VVMIEAQIRYAIACMGQVRARGSAFFDVRPAAQRAFNAQLRPRLQRSVFGAGCRSWYLDANGNNPTSWPGFTLEFLWGTRRAAGEDLEFAPPPP